MFVINSVLPVPQPADMRLLQDWSSIPLLVSQHAEGLLGRGSTGLLSLWLSSSLRRALTSSLPDLLGRLQQASLQGQQELRRECLRCRSSSSY